VFVCFFTSWADEDFDFRGAAENLLAFGVEANLEVSIGLCTE
jgi:hypothetical protein